ncbi:Aldo/keto reductase [Fomitiporia mediterranea MF3/22]|uniref:Aldo/keto reductase n=1 Tax=Fomitiporia mediterranea (strain MF3/22) TaxID=694068 RepID=UPI0004407BD4|nr:Aldo/keto reductase [Fomitiporia mediterranea MF3/22]EJD05263.1 Aldo/keto reductase [Fomitiporia mediterranea MF3/22]
METVKLGPFTVPRLFVGLWQLSSNAWGTAPVSKIRSEMKRHFDEGFIAFADHYGSAELLFGEFRQSLADPTSVVGATKWCVFRQTTPTRAVVEAAINERLVRMKCQSVDILQFHWQDYSDKGYLEALTHLQALQREGMIKAIGLCNFDAIRTDEICTQLGPGAIISNQVQFSLIDTRPLHGMDHVCEKHGIKLLTYGTLCGGFLADEWLGKPEPEAYQGSMTPSQRKYLDMIIKAWGDWMLFQSLLSVLRAIGDRHGGVSIANVATRWVLQHPFVGAVLVGTRLGLSAHTEDNRRVFSFSLTGEDKQQIEAILDQSNGRKLITIIGDCGAEYR